MHSTRISENVLPATWEPLLCCRVSLSLSVSNLKINSEATDFRIYGIFDGKQRFSPRNDVWWSVSPTINHLDKRLIADWLIAELTDCWLTDCWTDWLLTDWLLTDWLLTDCSLTDWIAGLTDCWLTDCWLTDCWLTDRLTEYNWLTDWRLMIDLCLRAMINSSFIEGCRTVI